VPRINTRKRFAYKVHCKYCDNLCEVDFASFFQVLKIPEVAFSKNFKKRALTPKIGKSKVTEKINIEKPSADKTD